MIRRFVLAAGTAATLAAAAPALAAPPDVVATVRPLHSLAAAVMQGVGEPTLLLPPGASPHDYSLKPSDARALGEADVVFWIGEPLEGFLAKSVDTLADGARVVALASAPDLTLLHAREGGVWEGHDHGHDKHSHDEHGHDEHGHDEHGHAEDQADAGAGLIPPMPGLDADAAELPGDTDSHIWLDPRNAAAMGRAMAAVLADADPGNAATYRSNANALAADLEALEAELRGRLAPVTAAPYIVFHDAYHYMEHRFGLSPVGSITVEPGRPIGARRLAELRDTVQDRNAACVFAEPQFEPRLIATVTENTDARTGVLDPLGSDHAPGPDLYAALMRDMTDALVDCLSAG
ncbi:zinc ABC transporter substrate-binding protein [Caenispirillum salinarum]|uniref:zinc ABC transporter substrate-binding protein n=1 Tax=Caenispirillum salinarum TaxID=859058 RepID=UPI0038517DC5